MRTSNGYFVLMSDKFLNTLIQYQDFAVSNSYPSEIFRKSCVRKALSNE